MIQMILRYLCSGLMTCCFLLVGLSLQAQLITHEDFEAGTAGSDLHDYPSGDFSTQDWRVQNGSTNGYQVLDNAPLVYPGLASSPNYASGGDAFQWSGIRLPTQWDGPFAQGAIDYTKPNGQIGYNGNSSEALWMSVLCRNEAAGNTRFSLALGPGVASDFFTIKGEDQNSWNLEVDGQVYPGAQPVTVNQTALLVLKMEFADDTTTHLELYVNPTSLGGTAPVSPDVSLTYQGTFEFRQLTFVPGTTAGEGAMDEIRFGSTYASVTPPGNLSLSVTATNGNITTEPAKDYYDLGDTVWLTANPALGYGFTNWSGDLSGNSNPQEVIMDSSLTITANFDLGNAPPAYLPEIFELVPEHQLILPVHLLLGDSSLFSDNLSFDFSSSNPDVAGNPVAIYQQGDHSVIVAFEGGASGLATLAVEISDNGALVASQSFDIQAGSQIGPENGGIQYVASDVAHWQPRPYKQVVTAKTGYPVLLDESYRLWLLSQSSGQAETDANYFFHGIMSGIIIPKETGTYNFEINGDGEGEHTLWLAEGLDYSNFPNESNPLSPSNYVAFENTPGSIMLEAGKAYYFEGHHRQIINDWEMEILWSTPGDPALRRLTSEDVAQYVDTELPTASTALTGSVGETIVQLSWEPSTDNDAIAGYHVFLNGARVNDELLSVHSFLAEGLTGDRPYEFAVVAVDEFGNHSFPSEMLYLTTAAPSDEPLAAPGNLQADLVTAFKAEVSWDEVPGALGYNLYVDGNQANEQFITANAFVVRGLQPETTYELELRSLNVSLLESEPGAMLSVTTGVFDASNPDEDVYLIDTEVTLEPLVKSTGMMLNFNINPNSAMIRTDKPAFDSLMADLQPAGFRFGAITANSTSFSESTGPNSAWVTYGEFAQASLDAGGKYVALTVGPGENEDYITNPVVAFTQFLEYLGGDGSTDGGARRIAEGFTAPFTDKFDKILIELGNEVWGGNAHDSPIGASYINDYLPWVQQVTDIITNSTYYDPERMQVVISARSPRFPAFQNTIFNANGPILNDTFPFVLGLSGYVGGNIMDEGEDFGSITNNRLAYHKESYNVMFNYLNNIRNINNVALSATGRTWPFYPYESNSTQTTYHGSLGQGLLTIDYGFEYIKRGGFLYSIFHLNGGQWRIINQNADGTYTKRPVFEVMALANQRARDGILLESNRSTVRRLQLPSGTEYGMVPIGVHAINRGNEFTVMYFSRDFENDFIARLNLPDNIGEISNGRITTLTGENFDSESVTVAVEDNVTINNGMLVDVPRHSLVMVSFEADDPELEAPLFVQEFDSTTGSTSSTVRKMKPLSVYPSPVKGQDAQLVLRGYEGQAVQIQIVDING
ncbi:MAG: hypothetical protein KI786_08890, partial [Mameliella sp.]|nr:hypothetical protein [Phaeodactylibacter sp.]